MDHLHLRHQDLHHRRIQNSKLSCPHHTEHIALTPSSTVAAISHSNIRRQKRKVDYHTPACAAHDHTPSVHVILPTSRRTRPRNHPALRACILHGTQHATLHLHVREDVDELCDVQPGLQPSGCRNLERLPNLHNRSVYELLRDEGGEHCDFGDAVFDILGGADLVA